VESAARRRKKHVPDPKLEPEAVVGDLDKQFRNITARHLPEYERAIGLPSANSEFREKVIDAVSTCMFQHLLNPRGTRPSQIRKHLLAAGGAARQARDSLIRLDVALNGLPESVLQLLEQYWGTTGTIARGFVGNQVSWLRVAASLTELSSKAFIDKGGAPKHLAFHVLAKGLVKAFEIGKGEAAKVNWNEIKGKWDGEFMALVEAVLPLVQKLAGTEPPLWVPKSPGALGKYLHDLTRANTRNKNRPRLRRKP
jgi:hypothetical protein